MSKSTQFLPVLVVIFVCVLLAMIKTRYKLETTSVSEERRYTRPYVLMQSGSILENDINEMAKKGWRAVGIAGSDGNWVVLMEHREFLDSVPYVRVTTLGDRILIGHEAQRRQ